MWRKSRRRTTTGQGKERSSGQFFERVGAGEHELIESRFRFGETLDPDVAGPGSELCKALSVVEQLRGHRRTREPKGCGGLIASLYEGSKAGFWLGHTPNIRDVSQIVNGSCPE